MNAFLSSDFITPKPPRWPAPDVPGGVVGHEVKSVTCLTRNHSHHQCPSPHLPKPSGCGMVNTRYQCRRINRLGTFVRECFWKRLSSRARHAESMSPRGRTNGAHLCKRLL